MRFEYIDRVSCVCGTPLRTSPRSRRIRAAWGEVTFRQCAHCGSWCQSPQVSPASLAQWYDSDRYQGSDAERGATYANYLRDEPQRLVEARARYRRDLEPLVRGRSARVLEIGCATGSVLSVLREHGHSVWGVDVSRRFADAARELHGVEVMVADFCSMPPLPPPFDLVLLFGTIGNLWQSAGALRAIRDLLAPGGTLLFNVPTCDSVIARLYGRRHWMFAPSMPTFLSMRGCELALAQAQLRIARRAIDRQQPSLKKLLTHAGAGWMVPALDQVGAASAMLPLAMPVPGVYLIHAVAADAAR